MVHRTLVVLATLLALSLAAVGQFRPSSMAGNSLNSGGISGTVRAGNNDPVGNVRIEVRSMETGQTVASTYTSPNGTFGVMNIPQGRYEVRATAGVSDTTDMVEVRAGESFVSLRLPQPEGADASNGATVSVSQFRVPAKARKVFRKAEDALKKQKYDEAEKQVNEALQLFPTYADALTLRALLRLDGQRTQEALQDLQDAIKADANYPLAYVVMGAAFNRTSKFDDAVRALQRGIVLNPASWQAYFELGKAFVGKGEFADAIRSLDRAQQMAPDNYAPLHLVKAHALLAMKNYPDAMTELEKYLERDPNGRSSVQARETLNKVRAFVATKK